MIVSSIRSNFLFFNPIEFQLGSADNALFSSVLHELDAMVGCLGRRWVCDWTAPNTSFVDGYFLSGMELGTPVITRVWRLTIGPTNTTAPHAQVGDPTKAITKVCRPGGCGLAVEVNNTDGTTTQMFFPNGTIFHGKR